MSAWEPKVGEFVACRKTFLDGDCTRCGLPLYFGDHLLCTGADLAPWLPAEDHAALLRLRDEVRFTVNALDALTSPIMVVTAVRDALRAALAATEHIR